MGHSISVLSGRKSVPKYSITELHFRFYHRRYLDNLVKLYSLALPTTAPLTTNNDHDHKDHDTGTSFDDIAGK